MRTRKGWLVKQSFNNDFTRLLERLYKQYGEEIFNIQGVANKHMDIAQFSKNFFGKSSNNVADISVDGNANVKEKNIMQYNYENNKALMKLNSFYILYKWVKKLFSEEDAEQAVEKVLNGELFINDFTNFSMCYCFAFDLRELLANGMNFFNGNMKIGSPKRSDSFIALMIQSTAYISNQIMGASSYPDFFVVLDKFYRQENREDYVNRLNSDKELFTKIRNQFQNIIYSSNFPFRGSQSCFTNLSVMDRGFLASLFDGYTFPDGSAPNLESAYQLGKFFFEYFSEINGKEGIFTFPVMTLAISLDKNNDYIDPEFVKWVADTNSEKALANVFQSKPNAFSSCCRLKNDFSKVGGDGYQNSFGVGGLSIGSHRVAGLNLPRLAFLEKKDPQILEKNLELVHKILFAHRKLIEDKIQRGVLPLYTTGWIHLRKQYSTIGFLGAYEYLRNKGLKIQDKEGLNTLTALLKFVEDKASNWQEKEKSLGHIYNIEQIPGESMCVRLAELDDQLGYNKGRYLLYSNQYIPLIDNASVYDRFRIQGKIDRLTSGGAILHLNVDDDCRLTPEQFLKIMRVAKDTGTVYFAVNYAYTEFENGNYLVGRHSKCPITDSPAVCQYTRVVGFITPVRSWNSTRKDFEYGRRIFYKNDHVLNELDHQLQLVGVSE